MGTAVRALGELTRNTITHDVVPWVIVGSGVAQIMGLSVFFFTMWTRIRALGSKVREAQGERF